MMANTAMTVYRGRTFSAAALAIRNAADDILRMGLNEIFCVCGSVIHDNTDYQSNKAYLIPDESYEKCCEAVENGMRAWDALCQYRKTNYQCSGCSRLYIPDDAGPTFATFFPDENYPFGALSADSDAFSNVTWASTWYSPRPMGRWYQIKHGNFFKILGASLSGTYAAPVTNASPEAGSGTARQAWAWR